ncbi:MAG: hypothetical protein ACOX88_08630 [Christensenellales bacterium]
MDGTSAFRFKKDAKLSMIAAVLIILTDMMTVIFSARFFFQRPLLTLVTEFVLPVAMGLFIFVMGRKDYRILGILALLRAPGRLALHLYFFTAMLTAGSFNVFTAFFQIYYVNMLLLLAFQIFGGGKKLRLLPFFLLGVIPVQMIASLAQLVITETRITMYLWSFVVLGPLLSYIGLGLLSLAVKYETEGVYTMNCFTNKTVHDHLSVQAQPAFQEKLRDYNEKGLPADDMTEAKLFAQAVESLSPEAPETAKISGLDEMTVAETRKHGFISYTVAGWVDSPNSNGTVIRAPFTISVFKKGGAWKTAVHLSSLQPSVKINAGFVGHYAVALAVTVAVGALLYVIFKPIYLF